MRLIVCGSRDWDDLNFVSDVLTGFYEESTVGHLTEFILIEGGQGQLSPTRVKGADSCARWWALQSPMHSHNENADDPYFEHRRINADWEGLGKTAGFVRNSTMLGLGPDMVFAFKDGFDHTLTKGGTEHMCKIAKKAGIPVRLHCHI